MGKGISTYGTVLKCGETVDTLEELVCIKEFPDLGGAPELLDTTTLCDAQETYINGIQSISALEFTANYTNEDFDKVMAKAEKPMFYSLEFGKDGSQGIFQWEGEHTAWVTGGGVNAVVDMTISIAPSTKITKKTTAGD